MIIHSFLVFPAVYTHRIIVVHLCPLLRDVLGKRSMIAAGAVPSPPRADISQKSLSPWYCGCPLSCI